MSVALSWNEARSVATVSLDRPAARNALTAEAMTDVADCFRRADAEGARIILLRGEGPSFCAGADRKQYPGFTSKEQDAGRAQHAIEIGVALKRALMGTNALTIAQIHGHAIGGGLVMAMCCDLRFAAEDARLSLPELRLGLPLGWGALYRLVELVGTGRAWSMLVDFAELSGKAAADAGLCSAAFPAECLAEEVETRIDKLLQIDAEALFLTKRQFRAIAARASFGNMDDIDGALLLGPLRGPTVRQTFAGL